MLRAVTLLLLLATSVHPVAATEILIAPDGTGDYPTIQAAINAAQNGDEIVLGPGTYSGAGNRALDFLGKRIVLGSQSGNPEDTILDAGLQRGMRFQHNETRDTRVEGLTITNGRGSDDWEAGGAVWILTASPTIRSCVFRANVADQGASVWAAYASPLIEDCLFDSPISCTGCAGGGIYAMNAEVTCARCSFTSCYEMQGGAIWAAASILHLSDCTFVACSDAIWAESGCQIDLVRSTLFFVLGEQGCIVLLNSSHLTGDHVLIAFGQPVAVHCDGGSTASLSCSDVYGNGGGDWVGGLEGQGSSNDNFSLDPRFCSFNDLDPHLRSDSPCADGNNAECGQVGSQGVECDAPVAVKRTTWGGVKARYH